MTVDVSPKLYEAATESLVSDASATSTFEKMISVAYSHATVGTFQQELKATEQQIKKEFEVSSMPGPWRSAKSVIQSSMKLGIALCDDNGSFYGKTFLQNKIKEQKAEEKEAPTEEDYINTIWAMFNKIPGELSKSRIKTAIYKLIQEDAM